MLILHAGNVTGEALERADGTAEYAVWVGINHHCIWRGRIERHLRKEGAARLLRLIADAMESAPRHRGDWR
jgi:hypothetical protein